LKKNNGDNQVEYQSISLNKYDEVFFSLHQTVQRIGNIHCDVFVLGYKSEHFKFDEVMSKESVNILLLNLNINLVYFTEIMSSTFITWNLEYMYNKFVE